MYDETIATHYAAYRPPIHAVILKSNLEKSAIPRIGLDIGCGTGQSSLALKIYCHSVIGIDPSEAMLGKAEKSEGIEYVIGSGEQIPVKDRLINIVTLAGSLDYINRGILISELNRVCASDAEVVVYDFDIDLSDINDHLALNSRKSCSAGYNHSTDMCGFSGIEQVANVNDVMSLDFNSSQVTHILLSDMKLNQSLQKRYREQDVFDLLKEDIEAINSIHSVKARVYYSSYVLSKKKA